jgi:hypothetical protein
MIWGGLALVLVWGLVVAGWRWAEAAKVTPDRVRAYLASVDLNQLSAADRASALRRLAEQLNALSWEDRRQMRLDGTLASWLEAMNEEERLAFVEATLPTGMTQMLSAFDELPEDRRRRIIEESVSRLRTEQERWLAEGGDSSDEPGEGGGDGGMAGPTVGLSPEMEEKVRELGLKTFYRESSAQAKAELAPLLEELQRSMESGRGFRRRERREEP